ncbi:hypothetical protein [Chryseobacterium flavum]|uniref:hypothetical protein n=1 Tax=Chryseobacterium flavum TaxID=415851 RepID=UPI0028B0A452|nr:hypothetical protein [Chryseobacterium flavum]
MKKNSLLLLTLFSTGYMYSQVGINTDKPNATLEVKSSPADISKTDGIISPKLKGSELKNKDNNYNLPQTGAIVYITEALDASQTSTKTVNVTTVGYYYFDGTKWMKLAASAGSFEGDKTPDAFVDDPTNTMVKLGTSSVGTNRAAGSDFVVKDNGYVGIGTISPTQKLDVDGTAKISQKAMIGTSWTGGGALSVRNNVASENIATLVGSDNVFKMTVADNGDVSIRGGLQVSKIPISSNTNDVSLVADSNGNIKKQLNQTIGTFRSYLSQNFNTGAGGDGTIYRLTNYTEVNDPGNNFEPVGGYFVAPASGLYRISMTVTLEQLATLATPNVVVGFASNSNWVLRFSIMKENIMSSSTAGSAFTFTGFVTLTQGVSYYFGSTGGVRHLAFPTGTSGSGIGSYFEVQLVQ